jgi:hypothetical protein
VFVTLYNGDQIGEASEGEKKVSVSHVSVDGGRKTI